MHVILWITTLCEINLNCFQSKGIICNKPCCIIHFSSHIQTKYCVDNPAENKKKINQKTFWVVQFITKTEKKHSFFQNISNDNPENEDKSTKITEAFFIFFYTSNNNTSWQCWYRTENKLTFKTLYYKVSLFSNFRDKTTCIALQNIPSCTFF